MDASHSEELISDVVLQESVIESEDMDSITLEEGKPATDLQNDVKQDLMEIQVFDEDLKVNAGENGHEDIYYPTENITLVENVGKKSIGVSENTNNKSDKIKSPKKLIRASPLKILPRPDPQNDLDLLNGNSAFEAKSTTPEKMLMRTADERKIKSLVIPMSASALKRTSLSLQEKMAIIQDLESGQRQSIVCKKRRLPKSTVQSIWKSRTRILGSVSLIGTDRKRCRRPQYEDVEEKLVEWMDSLKTQSILVNGPQLKAKAQVFAKCMGLTEFRASTGWLDKFKQRHNISFKKSLKSANNGAAGDKKTALDWVTKIWPSYFQNENYSPENIFNADEVALFYKATPEESMALKNETCHGGKMENERLTVLLCTNSVGTEKLKPLVIGCQANPKSFTWIPKLENLPVEYIYDYKSWMTREIFVYWLTSWDKKLKLSGRNVLLVIDNSPAHVVNVPLTNIKLVCLPPIVASILLPLEHGVTKFFKVRYRHLLLDRLVRRCEEMEFTSNPSISLLESISMVHAAWIEVSPQLISTCFKNTNLQSLSVSTNTPMFSPPPDNEEDMKDDPVLMEQAVRSGINLPDDFSLYSYSMADSVLHVTDYGIVDTAAALKTKEVKDENEDDDSDDDSLQNIIIPSRRDVQMFIDAIRNWAMISNENCDYSVHTALSTLESFASQQSNSLANLPIPIATNNSGSQTTNLANLNLNFVNGIPISIQNSGVSSNSCPNTVRTNCNSSQTVFYTPNFGTSQVVQGQSQPNVVTLPVDPPVQRNVTDSNEEKLMNNNQTAIQEQSHNSVPNSIPQNITNQQQPQYFAYLG